MHTKQNGVHNPDERLCSESSFTMRGGRVRRLAEAALYCQYPRPTEPHCQADCRIMPHNLNIRQIEPDMADTL